MYPTATPRSRYAGRINEASNEITALTSRLAALQSEIDRLHDAEDHFGLDEYENGTILSWEQCFTPGGHAYTFVAVKAAGLWFMTGPRSPRDGLSWASLTDQMVRGCDGVYPTIYAVDSMTSIHTN